MKIKKLFSSVFVCITFYLAYASLGFMACPPIDPPGECKFPQGVPDEAYTHGEDNDPEIAQIVNDVMVTLSGCDIGSDCPLGDRGYPTAQSWFDAVNAELRSMGLCAGQHVEGETDEIAVSNDGCTGRWYGYHIYNYGGGKVVWNPGAQRGWWSIDPAYCTESL